MIKPIAGDKPYPYHNMLCAAEHSIYFHYHMSSFWGGGGGGYLVEGPFSWSNSTFKVNNLSLGHHREKPKPVLKTLESPPSDAYDIK